MIPTSRDEKQPGRVRVVIGITAIDNLTDNRDRAAEFLKEALQKFLSAGSLDVVLEGTAVAVWVEEG